MPKNKKLLGIYLGNLVDSSLDVDKNIVSNIDKNEVNLISLHHKEEKEMTKSLHINMEVQIIKVDALFDSRSQANLRVDDLVRNIGLEVYYHPSQYQLGWVNKDVEIKFTKQLKIKFSISTNFIDEVEV
jgi:hypothetical protein